MDICEQGPPRITHLVIPLTRTVQLMASLQKRTYFKPQRSHALASRGPPAPLLTRLEPPQTRCEPILSYLSVWCGTQLGNSAHNTCLRHTSWALHLVMLLHDWAELRADTISMRQMYLHSARLDHFSVYGLRWAPIMSSIMD